MLEALINTVWLTNSIHFGLRGYHEHSFVKCPRQMWNFWGMPTGHSKDSSKCWFKASPMGVNKLTSLMKTMAGKVGFERRQTNHSARKRMMQKLNDNNDPSTHIIQLSGHRNLQSVKNYSTLWKEQQRNMLLIWETIQPHRTRRILLKLRKQRQLRNPTSRTVQLFLPQTHLVQPFFTKRRALKYYNKYAE